MSEMSQTEHERLELQDRLMDIDDDRETLLEFLDELYLGNRQNPQIFYAVASQITALTHLSESMDSVREGDELRMPDRTEAMRAFHTYTRLLAMLREERMSPLYAADSFIAKRILLGSREELAFLTILTYACAQGSDVVALPTPSQLNYTGARQATDIQVFLPPATDPYVEIQVKTVSRGTPTPAPNSPPPEYDPRIPILSLAGVLGSKQKAREVHEILWRLGRLDGDQESLTMLDQQEHDTLLDAAAAILIAAGEWQAAYARHQS